MPRTSTHPSSFSRACCVRPTPLECSALLDDLIEAEGRLHAAAAYIRRASGIRRRTGHGEVWDRLKENGDKSAIARDELREARDALTGREDEAEAFDDLYERAERHREATEWADEFLAERPELADLDEEDAAERATSADPCAGLRCRVRPDGRCSALGGVRLARPAPFTSASARGSSSSAPNQAS